MLREEYGINPAGMLGHSAGEIPCGYADGCLTREQTVLIAYHRGAAYFGDWHSMLLLRSPCRPAASQDTLCKCTCLLVPAFMFHVLGMLRNR
jgi:hypothetical protein